MSTSPSSARKPTLFIQRYAITIIIIVVLGTLIVLFYADNYLPPQPDGPPQFSPNVTLDGVANATAEAGNTPGFIGWRDGDTLRFPMKLRWSKPDRGAMHAVTIYDNRGNMVWSGASTDTTIAVERSLDAGLFYMMLEVDGVLRQTRRFVVLR